MPDLRRRQRGDHAAGATSRAAGRAHRRAGAQGGIAAAAGNSSRCDQPDECAHLQGVLARLADYDLVAFVSPNAIDCVFAHLPAWPGGVALAVVGEGSRLALAAHGVNAVQRQHHQPR